MFRRWLSIGGLAAALALAGDGVTAATGVQYQNQFETTSASASFASAQTFTFVSASRGTRAFERDGQEFVQDGTFVTINIFSKQPPGRFEFGCFKVADDAFIGALQGATLNVTVGPGVGNCGGAVKGGPLDASVLGGGGGGGPTGLSQALNLKLSWNPIGAVNHDTFSSQHSCLDFSSSSQNSRDSVRASANGTINDLPVSAGGDFRSFAQLSIEQGEFTVEGTPAPSCGFFRG
jgi:hypothetical protein